MRSFNTKNTVTILFAVASVLAFALTSPAQSADGDVMIEQDGAPTGAHNFRYLDNKVSIGQYNTERNFNIVAPEAVLNLIRTHPNYGALFLLRWRPSPGEPDQAHWMFGVDEFLGTGGFSITDRLRGDARRLSIHPDGNVGIGTTTPTHRLSVNGSIRAKEIIVDSDWADHVFTANYQLMSLDSLDMYIQKNRKLPGVPGANEIKQHGIGLSDANAILLEKIEELTLHIISLNQRISDLESAR